MDVVTPFNEHFEILLQLHIASCCFMAGVIWIVQLLVYPAFQEVDEKRFPSFHVRHTTRISYIVGPMMIAEVVTGLLVLSVRPTDFILITNLILLAIIWLNTFAVSVPLHNSLGYKRTGKTIERLVWTNWPRTLAWTIRSVLLISYVASLSAE